MTTTAPPDRRRRVERRDPADQEGWGDVPTSALEHPYIRLIQALVLAGVIAYALLQLGLIGGEPDPPPVTRIAAEDPITAAATAAREAYPGGAETVVLVGVDALSDGVVATGLAGALRAPILLTERETLSAGTRDVMVELDVREVILIGGDQAINALVARALGVQMELGVQRIAGQSRFDTAARVAEAFLAVALPPDLGDLGRTALVVPGDDIDAALEAGAVAAGQAGPIPVLISQDGALPGPTRSALSRLGIQHVVSVGGPVDFTGPVSIIDGVGAAADAAAELRGFRPPRVVLVPEGDDARALVAAPLAGSASGVVLPSGPGALRWLTSACETIAEIIVFGDETQITPTDVDLVLDAVTVCADR